MRTTLEVRAVLSFAFLIPMLLVQWTLAGASAVALDSTAGEKERGTLESILVTPVKRLDIILGKVGATTIFALCSSICSIIGLASTQLVTSAILLIFSSQAELKIAFGAGLSLNITDLLLLIICNLSISALISSLLIALGQLATSFKEAQTYIAPIGIFLVIALIALQARDQIAASFNLSLIPLLGTMIGIQEIVKKSLTLDELNLERLGLESGGADGSQIFWQ